MLSIQRQIIEQAKFTYSSLGKTWKTKKNEWRARKKQIVTITSQNEKLAALTNKNDHKDDHSDLHLIK